MPQCSGIKCTRVNTNAFTHNFSLLAIKGTKYIAICYTIMNKTHNQKTKAISFTETLLAILAFWLVMIAIGFFVQNSANAEPAMPKNDKDIVQGDIKMAGITFPIDEVKQNGRIVDMVITKNARSLKSQSTAYEFSVMKKISASDPKKCPLINSTAIDKDVKNYNPFSGRANLEITFITEDMAKKVSKADCLLLRDTETEPYSE